MINNNLSLIVGSLLTCSAVAGEVTPQTTTAPSFESDVTVGYDSQYIFRGVNFGNDLVSAAVNTASTCERTGLDFSAGAWYGSTTNNNGTGSNELDLTFGVSKDLGFADVTVGYVFYHFFNQADDAQEIYFGVSKDLCAGVSASLTYYWDIETDNNGYTELAASKSFEIAQKQLDLGVSLGYEAEEGKLSHITANLGHAVALSETATLTPYIAHTWDLEADDVFNAPGVSQENELFAGASLSVSF